MWYPPLLIDSAIPSRTTPQIADKVGSCIASLSKLVLLTDETPHEIPATEPNLKASTKSRRPIEVPSTDLIKPDDSFDIPTADTNEIDASKSVDWHTAANATIRQSLESAAAKSKTREFGNSPQQPQQIVAPPSVFSQPAHRFGDTDKTENGDAIVWLSDKCYQVTNSDVSHFRSFATGTPDTAKSYVRCKQAIDTHQANSHLFEHLKRHPEVAQ